MKKIAIILLFFFFSSMKCNAMTLEHDISVQQFSHLAMEKIIPIKNDYLNFNLYPEYQLKLSNVIVSTSFSFRKKVIFKGYTRMQVMCSNLNLVSKSPIYFQSQLERNATDLCQNIDFPVVFS